MLEIKRLHLATLTVAPGMDLPVHGFVVTHEKGAVLVDTGVGGPPDALSDWRMVNRSVADGLADIDMTPGDIDLVINTHLHFDHCGQNAVFKHAACWVQRTELERCKVESPELYDWFDFMNGRFELLDGDAEIMPGLSVVTTPGHTSGHQSVVVRTGDDRTEVLIGDAVITSEQYLAGPDTDITDGAADLLSWRESIKRLHGIEPASVHFCHDTAVVHR